MSLMSSMSTKEKSSSNPPKGGERPSKDFYPNFKVFHELMSIKVKDILLVSSPYDAYILEEDGSLASRIINEYSGLNLSQPPRVKRVSSARDALGLLDRKRFDMVITMPHVGEMDAFSFGIEAKKKKPYLPVILLTHSLRGVYPPPENADPSGIDKIFVWTGNSDLLLALVKNAEDDLNVDHDTRRAKVRVLILVEDSPVYYSTFLPLIYKEVVKQTQAVLESGLNEEHRLLTMRARPKILHAENYEEALDLCRKFKPYLFGIISDVRIPREGRLDSQAGFRLLQEMRREIPDLPLLMLSSEPTNVDKAGQIPAVFLDKSSPNLLAELHDFFLTHLGFGDFVFRLPDETEIDRASDLRALELKIRGIPEESIWYHARRNHFSNWIMGRSEITLASRFREVKAEDFESTEELREYLISNIHALRKLRQKGVVAQFKGATYDVDIMDFVKIGHGSLGGKARGLAFMSTMLQEHEEIHEKFPDVAIQIPKTLVITTEGFESFVEQNQLHYLSKNGFQDAEVAARFLEAEMPEWLTRELADFLNHVDFPLSVRSSSLLEDAQFQPYAGLYHTYMIPNNHPNPAVRLRHLITAVKLVYASTFYEAPKAFSRNTLNQPHEEAMAVIVQQLAGDAYGDFFYPALAGVAQSHNYYPFSRMRPEDGIANIALGMGKTVVDGERSLRFSPAHPNILPQLSTVEDMLRNSQRYFYALRLSGYPEDPGRFKDSNLVKRELDEAEEEFPVKNLAATYIPQENRIRDTGYMSGPKVLTFAQVLKHRSFPLPGILAELLQLSRRGMGCPVEIEFSVSLGQEGAPKAEFYFLQMRPMAAELERLDVQVKEEDIKRAFCRSDHAMGNGRSRRICDIVYVKPEVFQVEATPRMAEEVSLLNGRLVKEKRSYLLMGPGRWGTADRWLGIPVQWNHISGVGAMIELRNDKLKVDASQGSHFFQNITSLGIPYITVEENSGSNDRIDWQWLESRPAYQETDFLRHIRLEEPLTIKIDGRTSQCVIMPPEVET
ncbi:MAG: PEP/pyruvate-binding domain-containing protein [Desulfobacteraceae bacterium]